MVAFHCLILSASVGDEPWDDAPFSAAPEQIVEAADTLPMDQQLDVVVLLEDTTESFDGEGRQTQTTYQVYRILTEAGIDSTGSVSAVWSPWHQERPTIRARVINRNGTEHRLIEKEISELPIQLGENLYSDQRQLQAPLPAIEKGSIVEVLTTIEDSVPYFAGGISNAVMFNRITETARVRYRVEIPEGHPFEFRQSGDGLMFSETTANGRRQLEWTTTHKLSIVDFEASVPSDVAQGTQVQYSTGRSWADVATAYFKIVDERLRDQDLRAQAEGILSGESNQRKQIEKMLAFVQQQVRYTGLLFGDGTIVPTSPEEILRRRYGDCKDQSLLLIALLRAAGIDADPVLLRSSVSRDVHPELPGLGQFNHMIVRVRADDEFWIDPTAAFVPLSQLPVVDQGRLCLVIKPGEEHLQRTPASRSADNGFRKVFEFHINELEGTSVSETTTYLGSKDSEIRQYAVSAGDRDFRAALRSSAEARFQSADISNIRWSSLNDLQAPLNIERTCRKSGIAACTIRESQIALAPSQILQALPGEFLDFRPYMTDAEIEAYRADPLDEKQQAIATAKQRRRQHPLQLYPPVSNECVCTIHLPPGFEVQDMPMGFKLTVGQGTLEASYDLPPGGPLTAKFWMDSGSDPLTAADVEAWQKALANLCPSGIPAEWDVVITGQHSSFSLFDNGETAKAFRIQREEIARHPENIASRLRLGESYGEFGFVEAGRELSLRTTELAPESSLAYQSAAYLHSLPSFNVGRFSSKDRDQAITFFRKSVELDPENLEARLGLASHILRDEMLVLNDREALMEAASLLMPHAARLQPDAQMVLIQALFFSEQYDELFKYLAGLEVSQAAYSYRLASNCIVSGQQGGLDYLNRSVPAERHYTTLLQAVDLLSISRHCDSSAAMIDAALKQPDANRSSLQPARDLLTQMKRFDEVLFPETDARGVVQRAFANAAARRELCGTNADLIQGDEARRTEVIEDLRYGLFGLIADEGNSLTMRERTADSVSLMNFEGAADDQPGFRLTVSLSQMARTIYVASRNGRLKVITTSQFPNRLGEEALELLDLGDLPAARQCLQWASQDLAGGYSFFDPFAGSPLLRLWKDSDAKSADSSKIRLAAISIADPILVPDPTDFLKATRETAKGAEQLQIDRVLVKWYDAHERWNEALEVVERLLEKPQGRNHYWFHKGQFLIEDEQFEAAQLWAESQLERDTSNAFPLILVAIAEQHQGHAAASLSALRRAADHVNATPNDFNSAAWAALFVDSPDERTYDDAKKSVELSQSRDPAALHTLATVCAELGKYEEAMKSIRLSIENRRPKTTSPTDLYIPGRIAEHFGMHDIAELYYNKVISGDTSESLNATARLAEKRLAIIRQSAASPTD